MPEELKRCPCCGGRGERCSVFEGPASKHWDRCTQCGLMTPLCTTPEEADARWQARTVTDAADSQHIVDILTAVNGKLDLLLEEVDDAVRESEGEPQHGTAKGFACHAGADVEHFVGNNGDWTMWHNPFPRQPERLLRPGRRGRNVNPLYYLAVVASRMIARRNRRRPAITLSALDRGCRITRGGSKR